MRAGARERTNVRKYVAITVARTKKASPVEEFQVDGVNLRWASYIYYDCQTHVKSVKHRLQYFYSAFDVTTHHSPG
jgi:hypothetical protein